MKLEVETQPVRDTKLTSCDLSGIKIHALSLSHVVSLDTTKLASVVSIGQAWSDGCVVGINWAVVSGTYTPEAALGVFWIGQPRCNWPPDFFPAPSCLTSAVAQT